MTGPVPHQPPADPDWETYQAEQLAARDNYLAAIRAAQAHYDLDIAPALTRYHTTERTAWAVYLAAERAAKQRYLNQERAKGTGPGLAAACNTAQSPLPFQHRTAEPYPLVPSFTAKQERHR